MTSEFLSTSAPPDIADIQPGQSAALEAAARAAGFAVFRLDGELMKTKPALMEHAASALGFPGDFGRNWDALVDYLGDMSTFHKNDNILVFVENTPAMGLADPRLYADFREVCGLACENAREWSKGAAILKFVFIA